MRNKKSQKFQTELNKLSAPRNVSTKYGSYWQWDIDNYYPYKLIDLAMNCPQHAGLLNTEILLACGKDIEIEGNQYQLEIFNKFNKVDLYTLFSEAMKDYLFYNGFSFKINYAQNAPYGYLNNIDFAGVRVGIRLDDNNVNTRFFYSKDYRNTNLKENYVKEFNNFESINKDKDRDDVYRYCNFTFDKSSYYPAPDYYSAYKNIKLFSELDNYSLSSVLNGFHPSMLFSLKSNERTNMSDEDFADLMNLFSNDKGTASAGSTYVLRDVDLTAVEIKNQLADDIFESIKIGISQAINQAHSVTSPVVASFAGGGSLASNADEIKVAFQTFSNKNIKPKQEVVIKKINDLLKKLGWDIKIKSIIEVNILENLEGNLSTPKVPQMPIGETLSEEGTNTPNVNSTLTNLKGRQFQTLMRIVNQYKKSTLTRTQAALMLRSSFGFTDEEIDAFLDDEDYSS
jgi:hypothetical protein